MMRANFLGWLILSLGSLSLSGQDDPGNLTAKKGACPPGPRDPVQNAAAVSGPLSYEELSKMGIKDLSDLAIFYAPSSPKAALSGFSVQVFRGSRSVLKRSIAIGPAANEPATGTYLLEQASVKALGKYYTPGYAFLFTATEGSAKNWQVILRPCKSGSSGQQEKVQGKAD